MLDDRSEHRSTKNTQLYLYPELELEAILEERTQSIGSYSETTHLRIDDLVKDNGYELIRKDSHYEYWVRPASYEENDVLVRYKLWHGGKHYAYSKVKTGKLEEFCKIFSKYKKIDIALYNLAMGIASFASCILPFGALFSWTLTRENIELQNKLFSILHIALVGSMAGIVVASSPINAYISNNYKKKKLSKLETYCNGLLTNDGENIIHDKEILKKALINRK